MSAQREQLRRLRRHPALRGAAARIEPVLRAAVRARNQAVSSREKLERARAVVDAAVGALGQTSSLVVADAVQTLVATITLPPHGPPDRAGRLALWRRSASQSDDGNGDEPLSSSRHVVRILTARLRLGTLFLADGPEAEWRFARGEQGAMSQALLVTLAAMDVVLYWPPALRDAPEGKEFLELALRALVHG